jgi:dipeptidyl aminopeptidase/acylaminoacyl peptidase
MVRHLTTFVLLTAAAVAAAGPVLKGPPPREITTPSSVISAALPDAGAVPIADLFKTANSYTAVWSADGKAVIYGSDQGGRMNLWRQPVDGAGTATPLSQSDDRQMLQVVTPDGKWVVFESDHGGREIYDLFAIPATGGSAVNLTATDDASETSPVVSPDGTLLAYSSRAKTEPATDLGVLELATDKMRLLTHENDPTMIWVPVAFSKNGRTLLANRGDLMQAHAAVYRVDVASGAATRLTADEARAYNAASDWSPDGSRISVTTETAAGDRQAAILEVGSGKLILLKPDPWEQRVGRFSPDGRMLLAVSNVDGHDTIFAYTVHAHKVTELPFPPGINSDSFGDMPAFSPDGKRLLFPHSSGSEPLEHWIFDIATGTSQPVTHMANLSSHALPKTQIVHYRSADGTVISAVLWMPYNLKRDGQAAGIVHPHGGPTWQTKDSFERDSIALASRGYVTLAPNPRGSTGYGRAFMDANKRDLGGGDLEDEVAGARFLVATGYVSANKIGITGGSYGGYMTLMAIAKTPDLWAAAVDYFGIVNWTSMYERGSPQLRHYQAGLIGDPVHDKDVYARVSPLTYLGQTRAPLLVLQGENDIRVPKEESEQIVDFLNKKGNIVEVHYYPEEGHGFSKRENQIDALERTVAWFEKYLKTH